MITDISKTKINDLRIIPIKSSHSTSFTRYPESPFIKRALEIKSQNATGINTNTLSSFPNRSYVHDIVRQVDSSFIFPKHLVPGYLPRLKKEPDLNILFGKVETCLARNEKLFTHSTRLHEEKVNTHPGVMHTDTNLGINVNILLGKFETIPITKRQDLVRLQPEDTVKGSVEIPIYPKSLIKLAPAIFQTQKELGFKLNKTKPVVMLKSFNFDKRNIVATKNPNPLMQRQIEDKINGYSQITKGWKELIKHLEIFKDPTNIKKPDTQNIKISTISQKGKPIARINEQENSRVDLPTSATIQTVKKGNLPMDTIPQKIMKRTTYKSNYEKEKHLATPSKFYFQRKQHIITALQMDYPDIFSMSTSSRPALSISRPASTKKKLTLFTTRSPKVFSSRIIPEPAKDYPNVYFRATSLKERMSLQNNNPFALFIIINGLKQSNVRNRPLFKKSISLLYHSGQVYCNWVCVSFPSLRSAVVLVVRSPSRLLRPP